MWYMRQKEEFGEDRSQGIRFYDNTQTCDYLPHWHMTYEVIMVIAEDLTVIVENERHLLFPGSLFAAHETAAITSAARTISPASAPYCASVRCSK